MLQRLKTGGYTVRPVFRVYVLDLRNRGTSLWRPKTCGMLLWKCAAPLSEKIDRYSRHTKFFASSGLPWPEYWAYFGYAHKGRLRPGNAFPVAMTESGAVPFSTQST